MKFIRIPTLQDGLEPLRDRLLRELGDGKDILWLVPGGSNIPLTVGVMAQIPDEMTARLTIMLTDERYGPLGHKDSNAFQLDQTGFLPKQAKVLPVLHADVSLDETCLRYAQDFTEQARKADMIIGQFGMGADGHIAGCLPRSPAVSSADMTAGYEAPGFIRITLTPKALQQLTVAYVFAFGAEKRAALERLQLETVSLDIQPAQIIKQLPESYVYNDQVA
ncbi:MAG TPA: 6-phosphogluconolactonase [Candidatus Saccharimonadales bacterium]|jgi:6-phosphogluconolactonase/glucosamine-6-phosphate isomerase/deaminase